MCRAPKSAPCRDFTEKLRSPEAEEARARKPVTEGCFFLFGFGPLDDFLGLR
jgi:hypothetical protein